MHARRLPPSVRCRVVAAFNSPGLIMLARAMGTDRNVAPAPIDADRGLPSIPVLAAGLLAFEPQPCCLDV